MSWLLKAFVPYAPRHAQKSWMRINAFILAWTILSFIEILRTLEPESRLSGTRSYLIYNTTVCCIWTVECLLHLLEYHHKNYYQHVPIVGTNDSFEKQEGTKIFAEDDKYEIYLVMVELMLAVYYSYDAVRTFAVLWQVPNFNIGSELFDVLLDMVAYTYLTVRLRVYTHAHMRANNIASISQDSSSSPNSASGVEGTDYVDLKDEGGETEV